MTNFNKQLLKKETWNNWPFITYLFLAIQIIVYLLMELKGSSTDPYILHQFGAITKTDIVIYHEWWRFLTPIFVHIGFEHLFFNSLSLYFVGMQLESLIGHTRFFLVYLLSGILGNVFSFGFTHGNTISAGASTSIFGIIAAVVLIAYYFRDYPPIRTLGKNMFLFIILNLLSNLFSKGVDILGHVGGIVGGILMIQIVSFRIRSIADARTTFFSVHQRIISGMIYVFVLGLSIYLGFHRLYY